MKKTSLILSVMLMAACGEDTSESQEPKNLAADTELVFGADDGGLSGVEDPEPIGMCRLKTGDSMVIGEVLAQPVRKQCEEGGLSTHWIYDARVVTHIGGADLPTEIQFRSFSWESFEPGQLVIGALVNHADGLLMIQPIRVTPSGDAESADEYTTYELANTPAGLVQEYADTQSCSPSIQPWLDSLFAEDGECVDGQINPDSDS